jgi:hypothetical protein
VWNRRPASTLATLPVRASPLERGLTAMQESGLRIENGRGETLIYQYK